MKDKLQVISIIGARSGSLGIPNKNIKPFLGKPLMAWTIESALAASTVDRVIVSTDSAEYAAIARQYGAEAPFLRPPELADDVATTESFLKHCVNWLENNESYHVDIVVFLQATEVFRRHEWIDHLVNQLIENPSLDSAFIVHPTHKNYWKRDGQNWTKITDPTYGPRQRRIPIFREDTGVACATRANIIKSDRRLGDNIYALPISDDEIGIDIHTDFDFWLAQVVKAHHNGWHQALKTLIDDGWDKK